MRTETKIGVGILGALTAFSIILSLFNDSLSSFRAVFGFFYILFLPGFFLTILFRKRQAMERAMLSFALSLATIPLIIFSFSLLGIKITLLNTTIVVTGIIMASIILKNVK